jgi:hypothetical protein
MKRNKNVSFVISGPKRFLLVLFYCAKLPKREQSGQTISPWSRQRRTRTMQSPGDRVQSRQFRLCRQFGDRVLGMTLIIANSKQLDLLAALSCLQ